MDDDGTFFAIWFILQPLVYFVAIWNILWLFGIFSPILVCYTKKNLATLAKSAEWL
jgi:hypothetical protein